MKKTILSLLAAALLFASTVYSQAPQVTGTVLRAKNILEFHRAAIANPSNVLLLAIKIRELFQDSSDRYKSLNNDIATKLGIFETMPNSSNIVEVGARASAASPHGHFFISLKELTLKECTALAAHTALHGNFVSVEINGSRIAGVNPVGCKPQWPFRRGRNTVTFVSY